MRLILITIFLFTFSCTSNTNNNLSNSKTPNLNNISVSSAEMDEVRIMEEESVHMPSHLKNTEVSKKSLSQEAFDKIDELIKITIKLDKGVKNLNDIEIYRDEFSQKFESIRQYSDNLNSEPGALMVEYIDPINPLLDMTFDSQKVEDFKINLQELKVYLGNFYKIFSKQDSED